MLNGINMSFKRIKEVAPLLALLELFVVVLKNEALHVALRALNNRDEVGVGVELVRNVLEHATVLGTDVLKVDPAGETK